LPGECCFVRRALSALALMAMVVCLHLGASAQGGGFTIEEALSAPYTSELRAAPAKGRLAWVANIGGRRNLWVAEPGSSGAYISRQVTHYSEDDGQELSAPEWTAGAQSIVYVRGASARGETHPVPNPAWFTKGAQQQIWMVSADGGEPRLLAEGNAPAVSPDGKLAAYVVKGQVWTLKLGEADAEPHPANMDPFAGTPKPEQLVQTRGSAQNLRWSPDSARLAFVSDRDDHSFIAVYTMATKTVSYLDPSTDQDQSPVWSADSNRIAYLRIPSDKNAMLFVPHRTALPWSIRVSDLNNGKSREIWCAAEAKGSAFRETDSRDQLHWAAGDRIVFPWEREGWLHLYSVAVAGGDAVALTPGSFEVEHVSLSADGRTLVFDSNQNDIDRRHVWKISFDEGAKHAAEAVTSGAGIETQPVMASDGSTVAVLRSDVHAPMRAAVVRDGKVADVAPQAIPDGFPGKHFVTPQQVIFPAADGMEIHGQLFIPPNLKGGEQRPAAIFFHGGSQRQMLLGWHYMEYYSNAYAMNQFLASKGFVVLSVNYRSGIGYGLDFREALNYGADGASEFNDVLGAGLFLKNRPEVDPKRIACWGGSYGGYLTALALARASDLFAAGVDMHGVHDWNLEIPTFVPRYDAREHPDFARLAFQSSPLASVDTWRSPVLLIHGDDDRNVPFAETVQLVEALRSRKVDFEELIFPDEVHDFLLRRDWIRAYSATAEFLERKVGPAGEAAGNR
jgi:dipeptidyl aminopeptidase/acylaminoacyl peptidase